MQRWIWMGCAAVFGMALALPADAQWKWRDSSGRVQYSDLPPPASVADKDVLQRPQAALQRAAAPVAPAASAASAPAVTAKAVEPELEAKRRKVEEEKAAKDKAEEQRVAAAKTDNCNRARGQLRTLDDGVRIARTNAKGEREFLDDQTRAIERQRTLDIIATDCK